MFDFRWITIEGDEEFHLKELAPSSIPSMVPASLHLSVIPTVSPSIPHDVTFISPVIFTIGSHFIFSIFRANKLIQSSPFQCHPRQFFTVFISIQFSFCLYLWVFHLEFHKRYYLKIHLRNHLKFHQWFCLKVTYL